MGKIFWLQICIASVLIEPVFGQESWTKYPENPVLKRDTVLANLSSDLYAISDPWVIKEGDVYKMWYTCGGANFPDDTLLRARICYCESADGVNWEKYSGNPVLDVDYAGGWDSLGVETVSILIDSDAPPSEKYKMWYAGQYFNEFRYDIGYAFSADGLHWTKHESPVLEVGAPNAWDGGFIEGPSVVKDGDGYKMWYSGYDLTNGKVNTGYASSTDGISWVKFLGNPVLHTGAVGQWDEFTVQDPHVLKIGENYLMWYGGQNVDDGYGQQTGFATSSDGINWMKSPVNPVLTKGEPESWDAAVASFPAVIVDNGMLKMWYTGKDVDPIPENSLDYFWEIGLSLDSTFTAGLKSEHHSNGLRIMPNPFQGKATLQFDNQVNNSKIQIFNSTGILIKEINHFSGNEIILDCGVMTSGIYFLDVVLENGTRLHSKIVAL